MKTLLSKFFSILIILIALLSSCNNNIDVTGVTLNNETLTLTVNETATLIATVLPADATNQELIWESSDSKVVYVDNTGKITALAEETATITVTTADGGKTASCEVIVKGEGGDEGGDGDDNGDDDDDYPIEIPFLHYSLERTSCQWTNLAYDSIVVIINSDEEMNQYVVCMGDDNYPEIDFSIYTLLLANGKNSSSVVATNCNWMKQISEQSYEMEVEIIPGFSAIITNWEVPVIVSKLSKGSIVELSIK